MLFRSPSRHLSLLAAITALAGCASAPPTPTPYQEMGVSGGVHATQITSDTYEIAAAGNDYVSSDTIHRYALRKAAETTVAAGYRYFAITRQADRSSARGVTSSDAMLIGRTVYGSASTQVIVKPAETLMIQLFATRPPQGLAGVFDAADLLSHLAPQSQFAPTARAGADQVDATPHAQSAPAARAGADEVNATLLAYRRCLEGKVAEMDDGGANPDTLARLIIPACASEQQRLTETTERGRSDTYRQAYELEVKKREFDLARSMILRRREALQAEINASSARH